MMYIMAWFDISLRLKYLCWDQHFSLYWTCAGGCIKLMLSVVYAVAYILFLFRFLDLYLISYSELGAISYFAIDNSSHVWENYKYFQVKSYLNQKWNILNGFKNYLINSSYLHLPTYSDNSKGNRKLLILLILDGSMIFHWLIYIYIHIYVCMCIYI